MSDDTATYEEITSPQAFVGDDGRWYLNRPDGRARINYIQTHGRTIKLHRQRKPGECAYCGTVNGENRCGNCGAPKP